MKIKLQCYLASLADNPSDGLPATLCQRLNAIHSEILETHIQYWHNGHFRFGMPVNRTLSKTKYTLTAATYG